MAVAIVRSATYGERDPVLPVQALKAITPEDVEPANLSR